MNDQKDLLEQFMHHNMPEKSIDPDEVFARTYQALRRKPPLTGVAGAPLKGELPRVLTLYWFPWRGAGRDAA